MSDRTKRGPTPKRGRLETTVDPVVDLMRLNRLFRPACSDCGCPDLEWMGLGDVFERVGIDQGNELLELLEVHTEIDAESVEGWLCPVCGEFGVMGPASRGQSTGGRAG